MKRVFAFISLFAISLVMFGFGTSNVQAAEEPAEGKWFENPYLLKDENGNVVEVPMYIMDSITTTFPFHFDRDGATGTDWEDTNWGGIARQYAWNGVKTVIPQFNADGATGKYYGVYQQGASSGSETGIGKMIYTTEGTWANGKFNDEGELGGSYIRTTPHDPSLSFSLHNTKDEAVGIQVYKEASNQVANPFIIFNAEGQAVAGLIHSSADAANGLGQEFCYDADGVGVVADETASNCARVMVDTEEDDPNKPIKDEEGNVIGYEKVQVEGDDPQYITTRFAWAYLGAAPANLNNSYLGEGWKADNWDFYNEETGVAVVILGSGIAKGGAVSSAELAADDSVEAGHIRAPYYEISIPAGGFFYQLGYLDRGSTLLTTYKDVEAQAYLYGRNEGYKMYFQCYNYAGADITFVEGTSKVLVDDLDKPIKDEDENIIGYEQKVLAEYGLTKIPGTNTIEAIAGTSISLKDLVNFDALATCFADENDPFSFQSSVLTEDDFEAKFEEFVAAEKEVFKEEPAYAVYQEWLDSQAEEEAKLVKAVEDTKADLDEAIAKKEALENAAEEAILASKDENVVAAYKELLKAIKDVEVEIEDKKAEIAKKEAKVKELQAELDAAEIAYKDNLQYKGYVQSLSDAYATHVKLMTSVTSYVALGLGCNKDFTTENIAVTYKTDKAYEDITVTFKDENIEKAKAALVDAIAADDATAIAKNKTALVEAFGIDKANEFAAQYTDLLEEYVDAFEKLTIANIAIHSYIETFLSKIGDPDAPTGLYKDIKEAKDAVLTAKKELGELSGKFVEITEAKVDEVKYTYDEAKFNEHFEKYSTDLLADLSTWYGKEVTAAEVHNISETDAVTMYDFFLTDATFSAKWGWLADFMIQTRANDANQSDGASYLKDKNNAYWRYEVWAFLNKTTRASWPYSSDYSTETVKTNFIATCEGQAPTTAKVDKNTVTISTNKLVEVGSTVTVNLTIKNSSEYLTALLDKVTTSLTKELGDAVAVEVTYNDKELVAGEETTATLTITVKNATEDMPDEIVVKVPATADGLYKKLADAKKAREDHLRKFLGDNEDYTDAVKAVDDAQAKYDAAVEALGAPSYENEDEETVPATGFYKNYEDVVSMIEEKINEIAEDRATPKYNEWLATEYKYDISLDFTVVVDGNTVVFKSDYEVDGEYDPALKVALQKDFLADWAKWAEANGVKKVNDEYGLFSFFNGMGSNYFLSDGFLAKWGWLTKYIADNTDSEGNEGSVKDALNGKTSWYNYRRAAAEFVLFFAEKSGKDYMEGLNDAEKAALKESGASYILSEGSTSFADSAVAQGWAPCKYESYVLDINEIVNTKTNVTVTVKSPITGMSSSMDLSFVSVKDVYDYTPVIEVNNAALVVSDVKSFNIKSIANAYDKIWSEANGLKGNDISEQIAFFAPELEAALAANKCGEYEVIMTVTNGTGHKTTTKSAIVKIVDTIAPVVQVRDVYLNYGDDFHFLDGVYFAYDNVDGNLFDAEKFLFSANEAVNTYEAGEYTVEISAMDLSGNMSKTVEYVVYVNEAPSNDDVIDAIEKAETAIKDNDKTLNDETKDEIGKVDTELDGVANDAAGANAGANNNTLTVVVTIIASVAAVASIAAVVLVIIKK